MGVFEHLPYANFHNMNLDWILEHMQEFKATVDSLEEWKTEHEKEYEELKSLYDDFVAGNLPEAFENSLTEWIQNNAGDIIGEIIKQVYFGLTDDGYFMAYIPDSWDDIIFNTTGYDIAEAGYGYGHLVLSY